MRSSPASLTARDAGVQGPAAGSFTLLDRRKAEVLLHQTTSDLTTAANSIVAVAERTMRQTHALGLNDAAVNRIIAGGMLDGVPDEAHRELRKRLRRIAEGGLVETVNPRSGVVTTHKPEAYADMVFQTKTREAATIATAGRLAESGIDLVRIIGSDSANFCTHFVGKVFSLNGTHPEYPPLANLPRGGPPFHPRCSKTIVAFIEELATSEQIAKSRPNDAVRELMGATPAEAQRMHTKRTKPVPETLLRSMTPGDSGPPAAPRPIRRPVIKEGKEIAMSYVSSPGIAQLIDDAVVSLDRHLPKLNFVEQPKAFKGSFATISPMAYDRKTRTVLINPVFATATHLARVTAQSARQSLISSADPRYAVFQEIAHALHHEAIGSNDLHNLSRRQLSAMELRVARRVSDRATQNPAEFVAEVFVLLATGSSVAKDVEHLYRRLRGPWP